jgi:hypothetical protein
MNKAELEKFILDSKFKKSDSYACSKYHLKKGDHISKYERYDEVKEAYERGFDQAIKFMDSFFKVFKAED